VVPAAVAKALHSFLADTASGRSGLRVQPLATAAGDDKGQFFFVAAAAFAGASLIALVKPGARPNVIGDCFDGTKRHMLHCICPENGPSPFLAWKTVPRRVEAAANTTGGHLCPSMSST